jgi:hypothetical protein
MTRDLRTSVFNRVYRTDNWPNRVPNVRGEIDVLEALWDAIFGEVLGGTTSPHRSGNARAPGIMP